MTPPSADRITVLEDNVDVLTTEVNGVSTRMSGVETRLDGVEARLDRVEIRPDGVETRLGDLTTEMRTGFARVGAEFVAVREQMSTGYRVLEYQIAESEQRLRAGFEDAIKESEEETRRQMRVLHEEVLDRIATLVEARRT